MLNLSSLETKDNLPETKLPHVWLGFIFVFLFFASEIIEAFQGYERIGPFMLLSSLGGMIFWLFCVYRFHKVLNEMNSSYLISPGEAVGKHFIPFYNFYWLFAWTKALANFIRARGKVSIISGGALGAMLLVSLLISRILDGFKRWAMRRSPMRLRRRAMNSFNLRATLIKQISSLAERKFKRIVHRSVYGSRRLR